MRLVRGGDVTETPDGDPTTVDPDRVTSFDDGDTGEVGQDGPPTDGGEPAAPDTAGAAATLGITEDELIAALGDAGQGAPDFAAAAATLGVTEDELSAALGVEAGEDQGLSSGQ